VGIPLERLPAVIERAPRLLMASVENTLRPNLLFFTRELNGESDLVTNLI